MRKKTTEEFIKDARKVHGDKYDYSKVKYVNSTTKVCIICPKHGEFWQEANSHLRGNGCSKCSGCYVPTKEEWISSARKAHGNKYDYTKVEYVNNLTNVCIKCPEHGEFWQMPFVHIKGHGCKKCSGKYSPTTEEWIASAHKVHGDKYDYTKVEYVNCMSNVCIICPEHGEFWQTPHDHLGVHGCPKCANYATGERCRSSKEEFIKKANEKHDNKYDYTKVGYMNAHTKVCIICPEHGEFWQKPNSHLNGNGCPICNSSKLEITVHKSLKENNIFFISQYRSKWLGSQSLDFYLPDYNVGIECQGGQHFFPVEHFDGDKGFKKTLQRDKRKFKKCQKNGIKILYYSDLGIEYPYEVFEDVDLLFEEIKNIQVKKK